MIQFDKLEANAADLQRAFRAAQPFSHLVLDGFCDAAALRELVGEIPDPAALQIPKSRDLVFAKAKYQQTEFRHAGPRSEQMFADLTSARFQKLLCAITGEDVFVDAGFHGGGFHQGGRGSFLDMHADFNYHPERDTWLRNLNILLYLNDGWAPDHGGQLKLRHKTSRLEAEVAPLFNRCVIMHTRDYTLHGYDPIQFPAGAYRRSVAAYAYTLAEQPGAARTTTWFPERGGPLKRALGRAMPQLVSLKAKLLG